MDRNTTWTQNSDSTWTPNNTTHRHTRKLVRMQHWNSNDTLRSWGWYIA